MEEGSMERVKIFVSDGPVRGEIREEMGLGVSKLEDNINNWILANSKKISIIRAVQSQSEQRGGSYPVITITIFYEAV